jgi:hypothetical protein
LGNSIACSFGGLISNPPRKEPPRIIIRLPSYWIPSNCFHVADVPAQ